MAKYVIFVPIQLGSVTGILHSGNEVLPAPMIAALVGILKLDHPRARSALRVNTTQKSDSLRALRAFPGSFLRSWELHLCARRASQVASAAVQG